MTGGVRVPEWTVADRLRKAREFAGLTQKELADEIGVSNRSISAYESGSPIKRPVLLAWSLRTGVPIEWLRDGVAPNGPDHGTGRFQVRVLAQEHGRRIAPRPERLAS